MRRKVKRTKPDLAKDIATILGTNLHQETKRVMIDNALWNWSGYEGKINGCKYWTRDAMASDDRRKLIHEHVVPRKELIDKLMNNGTTTEYQISEYLKKYCIGVVVTKDEDRILNEAGLRSSMPADWDQEDPWARYKVTGIYEDLEPKPTGEDG